MSKITEAAITRKEDASTRGQRLWNRLVQMRRDANVSIERAKLVTASWKETEGLPIAIRRAKAFEKIVTEIPIFIDDEQLLCGDLGSKPMSAEFFPELSVEWLVERYEAGGMGSQWKISDEEAVVLKDIAQYWKDKSNEAGFFRYLGQEQSDWLREMDYRGNFINNVTSCAVISPGWKVPDYERVIKKGLLGLLADVEEELQATTLVDEASRDKTYLLEALVIFIKAAIRYAGRYAELAREKAKSVEPKRKAELEKMAAICARVPANPARTFHEALQSMWFCHLLNFWEVQDNGVSPGRVDQYLYPYYQKDIEEGRTTREEAIELLELIRCKFSCTRAFSEVISGAGATGGEAEWFNCILGGVTADGKDATNEMSYLWLEAAKRVGTPHPTLSIRVHRNMNEDFAMKAAELTRMGRGYPAWFGDNSNIGFLLAQGVSLPEARGYAIGGCTISQIPGKSVPPRMFMGNIGKMLELTLYNGFDPYLGKIIGPETGNFEDFGTYDELWESFTAQVRYWLRKTAAFINKGVLFQPTVMPYLALSLYYDDCIKRGLPANGGGCRYEQGQWYLLPTGPVDVADSLAAIKKCVYEDKTITRKQLIDALKANFEGEEYQEVRRKLLAVPKYGNDDDYVDFIARDIYSLLDRECSQIDGCYGARYVCSPHSIFSHGPMGVRMGALPSGRLALASLADGNMSPAHGMDRSGPTAVIKSAGKIDQLPMQGTLLNQKFSPSALKTKEDLQKFLAFIKTYLIDYGGKHIQFNVADRETLLDAKAHPENYRDLVVRVAGYSALWVELVPTLQDEIIARTEQTW